MHTRQQEARMIMSQQRMGQTPQPYQSGVGGQMYNTPIVPPNPPANTMQFPNEPVPANPQYPPAETYQPGGSYQNTPGGGSAQFPPHGGASGQFAAQVGGSAQFPPQGH